MSAYRKIGNASVDDNNIPFHQEVGVYIVMIKTWVCRDTRENGPADFCTWRVVKTLAGQDITGLDRVRMSMLLKDAALADVKQRAVVAMTINKRIVNPNAVVRPEEITAEFMDGLTASSGDGVRGILLKIQTNEKMPKPKPGQVGPPKPYTAISYSIPTPQDLEGLKVVNGRLAE